ncbi:hypothetical protein VB780_25970 [Leptolyngbya sp. CCNP1308]|uniref:hypothetical protein n=1 Tax=Leptolyngbya sp. CCNP1308 TaxID=3110255 RepID=UPI002B22103E|nr:hypothetical protein [Leptolyngbya sp. CCNP1308]MEA5452048.1 hypothetical protein [Leptolyngbya sp. CCNP1308]
MLLQSTAIATTRAAKRGPGRRPATRWYHVRCGGYEPIYTAAGEPVSTEFVLDGFRLEVPDTYLGLGTRDRIFAAAAERCPGKDVLEFKPIARPIAA